MTDAGARRNRVRTATCIVACAVGAIAFGLFGHPGGRAAVSFVCGVLLAFGAFAFGAFNIRLADRYAPQLTMAIALFSYAITAIGLALLAAVASPRVVHPAGIAVGLLVGLVLWLGFELATAVTGPEARSGPP